MSTTERPVISTLEHLHGEAEEHNEPKQTPKPNRMPQATHLSCSASSVQQSSVPGISGRSHEPELQHPPTPLALQQSPGQSSPIVNANVPPQKDRGKGKNVMKGFRSSPKPSQAKTQQSSQTELTRGPGQLQWTSGPLNLAHRPVSKGYPGQTAQGQMEKDQQPNIPFAPTSQEAERYRQPGNMKELDNAIYLVRRRLSQTSCPSPLFTSLVARFGILCTIRYQLTKEVNGLDDVIQLSRQVWQSASTGNFPARAACLYYLAVYLRVQYQATGDISNLTEGIRAIRETIELEGMNHPKSAKYVDHLAWDLWNLFQAKGNVADLEESISLARQVLKLAPSEDRPRRLDNLSLRLERRYDIIGETHVLEQAIQFRRQGIECTSNDDLHRREYLDSLGISLVKLYWKAPNKSILNDAIQAQRDSIKLTASDHPDWVNMMLGLGVNLKRRYQLGGELIDINNAISVFQQLLKFCPENHPAQSLCLCELGSSLRRRYELSGEISDIDDAIEFLREAINSTPNGNPKNLSYWCHLGLALGKRYEGLGKLTDIEAAIEAGRYVVVSTTDDDVERAFYLHSLSIILANHYQRLKKMEVLEEAIQLGRQVLPLSPDDDPNYAIHRDGLSNYLSMRFSAKGDLEDLKEAIRLGRQAAASLVAGCSPTVIYNLGSKLLMLHSATHDLASLNEAIEMTRQMANSTPLGHPGRVTYLANLGIFLNARYKHVGDASDLEEATRLLRQAQGSVSDKSIEEPQLLYHFTDALKSQYIRTRDEGDREKMIHTMRQSGNGRRERRLQDLYWITGDRAALDEQIKSTRQTLDDLPRDDQRRAGSLASLSGLLGMLFDATGEYDTLEEAIKTARLAVQLGSGDASGLARCLYTLGTQLGKQYEWKGEITALEESIRHTRKAMKLIPENDPNQVLYLNSLGARLRFYYLRTGKAEAQEEGLAAAQQALKRTPDTSDLLGTVSDNLASQIILLFNRTHSLSELEDAIRLCQQAVRCTPDGHVSKARFLNNLASCLELHHDWTHEMASLTEASHMRQNAINCTPEENQDKIDASFGLAGCLLRRYQRTGRKADIDEAMVILRSHMDRLPSSYPELAYILDLLANSLEFRYDETQCIADLDEAIQVGQRALDIVPLDAPSRESIAANLLHYLRARYDRTAKVEDIDRAILLGQQIVASSPKPPDDRNRAHLLFNLGTSLAAKGKSKESFETFASIWNDVNFPPLLRAKAAARILFVCSIPKNYELGIEIGYEILRILPTVNTRALQRKDQQEVISAFGGVASNTFSLCFATGQPYSALQFLEMGRTVIIGQIITDSSDIPKLAEDHPDLACRYRDLVQEISAPSSSPAALVHDHLPPKRLRHEAMEDWYGCLKEIRTKAGYARFLLPPTTEELHQCAAGGIIVTVNLNTTRGDAILITAKDIGSLTLPAFTSESAKLFLNEDWTMKKRSEWRKKNDSFSKYLEWLWVACVKPIVEAIDTILPSKNGLGLLPKVWWIGTGLAHSMPFHAAGIHTLNSMENAFNRIVSSYTPSFKALAFARQQASRAMESTVGSKDSMLVVTMALTPKSPTDVKAPRPLPGVIREATEITKAAGSSIKATVYNSPSVAEVLDALPGSSIAHFACHGSLDRADRSNGGLILQRKIDGEDGTATFSQDRLTMHRVSELKLKRARIAYLSACSTAENEAERLSDEVLHVVSGFQVAGFPHVIGCLWPAGDDHCVRVAAGFYSMILQPGQKGIGHEPARALQESVQKLRDEEPRMPLNWAQFVHYGL